MDMDKLIAHGAQVVSGSVILNGKTIGQPLKDGTVLLNAEGESIAWGAEVNEVPAAPKAIKAPKAGKAAKAAEAPAPAEPAAQDAQDPLGLDALLGDAE